MFPTIIPDGSQMKILLVKNEFIYPYKQITTKATADTTINTLLYLQRDRNGMEMVREINDKLVSRNN